MSKFIYTSFSPNTRGKDMLKNLWILFTPWKWQKGSAIEQLQKWFSDKYSSKNIYTFNYARSGLFLLLKSLNLPKNSEILVQGFTCTAVVNPIVAAGLKPIYVDISKASFSMDIQHLQKKITSQSRVLIIQHTFGYPANIEGLLKIAKKHNLLVIEDCAHTILGSYKNKLLGKFGDASIFSLGRDKIVSGIDGGVLLINNPSLILKFEDEYKKLNHPSHFWILRELTFPLCWALIKGCFTFHPLIGKSAHFIFWNLGLIKTSTTRAEKLGRFPHNLIKEMPNSLAELALVQLHDLDELNSHRLKIYQEYLVNLKNIFKFSDGAIPLRVPIVVDKKVELLHLLENKNIYLGDWYSSPITPTAITLEKLGYKNKDCPVAEEVSKKIINLPTHINLSIQDVQTISKHINEFYGN